eukprot:CAMPEP_0194235862 /NCGR_PEP_ID=MMETSP0158-20130606/3241_1 /TAXON_ID=33649 /ORGANISM="Thalassionema nitzschioides, Strain L26-B" /LENGTH=161 /DNA_ID=CAMNT_0038969441 /DNA_START=333 /DNA_END=814 /DNA_ORIENTATION=+
MVVKWEGGHDDVNGTKHGYGVLTNETENIVWKGTWEDDEPIDGKWRISYADGGIYSGQAEIISVSSACCSSLLSSSLTTTNTNNNNNGMTTTIPYYISAVPEGFGTFQYPNGDIYVGNFEEGARSGIGSCHFASGEHWKGTWMNDALDHTYGYGVLTKADG